MDQQDQNENVQGDLVAVKSPKIMWAVIITAIVVAILVGGGIYVYQAQKVKNLEKQLTQINKVLTALAAKTVVSNKVDQNTLVTAITTSSDKYEDWKTLTDTTIGFSIKYPKDWIVKIEDGVTDKNAVRPGVKYHYISMYVSSTKNWYFGVGISKKGSGIATSLRTGVGGVSLPLTPSKVLKVAGSDFILYESDYSGKISEIFSYDLKEGSSLQLINKDYYLDATLSFVGTHTFSTTTGIVMDEKNTISRQSQLYQDVRDILESITFINN